jgi:hypothetical protein
MRSVGVNQRALGLRYPGYYEVNAAIYRKISLSRCADDDSSTVTSQLCSQHCMQIVSVPEQGIGEISMELANLTYPVHCIVYRHVVCLKPLLGMVFTLGMFYDPV